MLPTFTYAYGDINGGWSTNEVRLDSNRFYINMEDVAARFNPK